MRLIDYKRHPVFNPVRVDTNCRGILSSIRGTSDSSTYDNLMGISRNPQVDAAKFYLLNHAVGVVSESLKPWEEVPDVELFNEYTSHIVDCSINVLRYLYIVTFREARHLKSAITDKIVEFLKESGSGVDSVRRAVADKSVLADVELADFFKIVSAVFYNGAFSSCFGGKPWGDIARTGHEFVAGITSAERFLDMCFSLEHNTSSVFNKDVIYKGLHQSELKSLLNAQRDGKVYKHVLSRPYLEDKPEINTTLKLVGPYLVNADKVTKTPNIVQSTGVVEEDSVQEVPIKGISKSKEKAWIYNLLGVSVIERPTF